MFLQGVKNPWLGFSIVDVRLHHMVFAFVLLHWWSYRIVSLEWA